MHIAVMANYANDVVADNWWQASERERLPEIVQPSSVEALTALGLYRNPKKDRSATIMTTAPTI